MSTSASLLLIFFLRFNYFGLFCFSAGKFVHPALGWRPSLLSWRPLLLSWRPSMLGWRPSMVGWRPSMLGWRPSMLGWRPSMLGWRPLPIYIYICVFPLCTPRPSLSLDVSPLESLIKLRTLSEPMNLDDKEVLAIFISVS